MVMHKGSQKTMPQFDPARRWNLVLELAEDRIRLPDRYSADPVIRDLWRFWRVYREDEHRARESCPHCCEAFQVYEQADDMRWLIEALIIGGLPTEEIAEQVPLATDTLKVYEAGFYDVRPFLSRPLFVLTNFLGKAIHRCRPDDRDLMWKLISFTCGPDMLIAFSNPAAEATPEQWAMLSRILSNRMLKNAIGGALLTTPNDENKIELQKLQIDSQQGGGRGDPHGTSGQMEAQMEGVLATVSMLMQKDGGLITGDPPGKLVNGRWREPTYQETMASMLPPPDEAHKSTADDNKEPPESGE